MGEMNSKGRGREEEEVRREGERREGGRGKEGGREGGI